MCLVQLAKHFPSAGGYFTYVSRTIGPRSGWLTGWMFALYSPIVAGPILAFLGLIFEGEFQSNWDWTWFHWWMMVIVFLPIITLDRLRRDLALRAHDRGRRSARVPDRARTRACGDSSIQARAASRSVVFSPSYDPGNIIAGSGFLLAVVFTVQGLTGWEAAVPLAEETENPRRNVPIATMASIVIVGVMLVLVFWGQVVGWGTSNLAKLPSSEEIPALTIAHRVWGESLVARAARDVHLGDRREPRMSERRHSHVVRDGPRGVAARGLRQGASRRARRRPPRSRRSSSCRSRSGSCAPQWIGPANAFILSVGYMLVIAVIFVYIIANVGVILYFWTKRRDEFNWILHFVFPVGTSIVLLYSLDKSFNPLPAYPGNWAPWLVIGWFVAGDRRFSAC